MDTNTHVILGIEARQVEGQYRWHSACASFADWELHVRLDDAEVWTDPGSWDKTRGATDVHWVRRVGPLKLPASDKVPADGST